MIEYRSLRNWKYQLTKDYMIHTGIVVGKDIKTDFIDLTKEGILTVFRGYCWDGASGGIDTRNFMRGSLVHDCGCQLIEEGLLDKRYRPKFDLLLKDLLLEEGMSKIRAEWVYRTIKFYVRVKY